MVSIRKFLASIAICCMLPIIISYSANINSNKGSNLPQEEVGKLVEEAKIMISSLIAFFENGANEKAFRSFATDKLDWPRIILRNKLPGVDEADLPNRLASNIANINPETKRLIKGHKVNNAKPTKESKNFILIDLSLINEKGETVNAKVELSKGSRKIVEISLGGLRLIQLFLANGEASNVNGAK